MQSISIGYGKANFDTASTNLSAFVIEAPWVRQFPSKMLDRRSSRLQVFPVTQHPEIGGKMMLDTLGAQDGVIILLQSSNRMRGVSIQDGAIFLYMREQGPMHTVSAKIMPHRDSLIGNSYLMFQGRCDIFGLDELAEIGIFPQQSWIDGFMQADEIEQSFDILELQAGTAPPPKLERFKNLSGEEVTLKVAAPQRKIKLR